MDNNNTFMLRSFLFCLVVLINFNVGFAQVPLNEVTEEPSTSVGRFSNKMPPKVLLGLAQIPQLADVDTADWTYVREHLDGIWANAANTGVDNAVSISKSVNTENYFFIGSIQEVNYGNGLLESLKYTLNTGLYNGMSEKAKKPKAVFVNDYITKDGNDSLRYYGEGYLQAAIDWTRKNYFDGENPFNNGLYITVRTGQFNKKVYNKTYNPATTGPLVGRAFSTMKEACESGGGVVWERAPQDFMAPGEEDNQLTYIQAFNRAHELGGEFIWLMPRGNVGTPEDHTNNLVKAYQWFEENEIFPDKIVVIGYSRAAADGEIDYLAMLPMINPTNPDLPALGSFTGTMYWCIKQRENYLAVGVDSRKTIEPELCVYPNPATTIINIEGLEANSVVEIYSINGSLLLKREMSGNKVELDISAFTKGIYLLRGQTKDRYFVHKIVIE